jgi:hypothetical protein
MNTSSFIAHGFYRFVFLARPYPKSLQLFGDHALKHKDLAPCRDCGFKVAHIPLPHSCGLAQGRQERIFLRSGRGICLLANRRRPNAGRQDARSELI